LTLMPGTRNPWRPRLDRAPYARRGARGSNWWTASHDERVRPYSTGARPGQVQPAAAGFRRAGTFIGDLGPRPVPTQARPLRVLANRAGTRPARRRDCGRAPPAP